MLQSPSVRRDDNFLTSRVRLTNLLGFSTTPQCTPMTSWGPDDQRFILQGPEKKKFFMARFLGKLFFIHVTECQLCLD